MSETPIRPIPGKPTPILDGILHDLARDVELERVLQDARVTPVPDEIFTVWLSRLTHAELCILLYMVHHSYRVGQGLYGAPISLNQFSSGARTPDDHILDEGCGLKSRSHIRHALEGLEEKGLVYRVRQSVYTGGDAPTLYVLRLVSTENEG